jgi:hypothetical protein
MGGRMKYQVSIARIEHRVYVYEVEAESKELAENQAWLDYEDDSGDNGYYGEVVHAEEFINDVIEEK